MSFAMGKKREKGKVFVKEEKGKGKKKGKREGKKG